VSFLRPARKIPGPAGEEWEVWISRDRERSEVRIEAITYYPRRESYLWTTSADHEERVLRQISAGLEAGDLARPLGCNFVGRSS
jgi:hypothetical protein